jgi:hypothetical protein
MQNRAREREAYEFRIIIIIACTCEHERAYLNLLRLKAAALYLCDDNNFELHEIACSLLMNFSLATMHETKRELGANGNEER